MEISIGKKKIGDGHPIFIIAEAGVNHNGDLKLGKKLIDQAVEAKVDAVKFQTFKAEELNTHDAPKALYHLETTGSDNKQTWYDLLKSQEISYEMHEELISYCKEKKIMFLSTPYSKESVDLLENFNLPAYKISSADINNLPFLEYVANKGKPIIISTGMSNMGEIELAKDIFLRAGLTDYVLLQCTSNYPTNLKESNLNVINTLRKKMNCLVGYSDHTEGYINPIAATALGACIFEKHFTLDKNLPGPDHRMSLDPDELIKTVSFIRMTEQAIGSSEKTVLDTELDNRTKLRKSIVTNIDIKKNQIIEEKMLGIKRPGSGISPNDIKIIIGKKAIIDIPSDTVLSLDMLDVK